MNIFTYSFEDTTVTISHPDIGSYSAYGTGIGSVSVEMAGDIAQQDVSADLAVIVSKHARKNGTVTFDVLQSSDFNQWLKKFYNRVISGSSDRFALATIIIRNNSTGDKYTCTGVHPQRLAANSLQSTAQNRSWPLMAANIEAE